MVLLGIRNSPMKDFHDIWVLSETFAYDGVELQQAIVRCFDRRGSVWAVETPEALTPSFFANAERLADWNGYRHLVKLSNTPPPHFEVIGRRIQSFLAPVRASILSGKPFEMHWPAGGPWQAQCHGEGIKGYRAFEFVERQIHLICCTEISEGGCGGIRLTPMVVSLLEGRGNSYSLFP